MKILILLGALVVLLAILLVIHFVNKPKEEEPLLSDDTRRDYYSDETREFRAIRPNLPPVPPQRGRHREDGDN